MVSSKSMVILGCALLFLMAEVSGAAEDNGAALQELAATAQSEAEHFPTPQAILSKERAAPQDHRPVASLILLMRQAEYPAAHRAMQLLEAHVLQAASDSEDAATIADALTAGIVLLDASLTAEKMANFKADLPKAFADVEFAMPVDDAEETVTERLRFMQQQMLGWLGMLLTEEQAGLLSPYLHDTYVGRDAILAMLRLPGDAPTELLMAALDRTNQDTQIAILEALQHRSHPELAERILEHGQNAPPAVKWACIDALSYHGVPPTTLMTPHPELSQEEQRRFARAGLRSGAALAAQGERTIATNIYSTFTDIAAFRYQSRAALVGMADVAANRFVEHALGYLTTPGIRETAIRLLARYPDIELDSRLVRAYAVSDTAQKIALLEVLEARKTPELAELLAEALEAEAPELRCVAYWMREETPPTEDLLAALEGAVASVREEALFTLLDKATPSFNATERLDLARAALHGHALSRRVKERALAVLGSDGEAMDGATITAQMDVPHLLEAALAAYVAWAGRQPNPDALLRDLLKEHMDTLVAAASQSPERFAEFRPAENAWKEGLEANGYITTWKVLGPLPLGEMGLAESYFQEARGATQAQVTHLGETYAWVAADIDTLPGALYFDEHLPVARGGQDMAYAYTRLQAADWTNVRLRVRSSGALRLLHNGNEALPRNAAEQANHSPLPAQEAVYELELRQGQNSLLLKLAQPTDRQPWYFQARLEARDEVTPSLRPLP